MVKSHMSRYSRSLCKIEEAQKSSVLGLQTTPLDSADVSGKGWSDCSDDNSDGSSWGDNESTAEGLAA